MDVLNPNAEEFPSWAEATPWIADLTPGQLLIWGPNWAHHVATLSDSVTVSLDVVNGTNLEDYALSQDWMQSFGGLARQRRDSIEAAVPDAFSGLGEDDSDQRVGMRVTIQLLRAALSGDLPAKSRLVKQQMLSHLEKAEKSVKQSCTARGPDRETDRTHGAGCGLAAS